MKLPGRLTKKFYKKSLEKNMISLSNEYFRLMRSKRQRENESLVELPIPEFGGYSLEFKIKDTSKSSQLYPLFVKLLALFNNHVYSASGDFSKKELLPKSFPTMINLLSENKKMINPLTEKEISEALFRGFIAEQYRVFPYSGNRFKVFTLVRTEFLTFKKVKVIITHRAVPDSALISRMKELEQIIYDTLVYKRGLAKHIKYHNHEGMDELIKKKYGDKAKCIRDYWESLP